MTKVFCLLAQMDGLNPLNPTAPVGRGTGMVFKDVMVILATGLALALMLLLWARYYVRTKKRHHHHERRRDPIPVLTSIEDGEDDEHQHGRRRRRRRHRRDHRPRNPTLAETGGLPPSKAGPTSNPPL